MGFGDAAHLEQGRTAGVAVGWSPELWEPTGRSGSVVDEVDVCVRPVARSGDAHEGADRLGDPAAPPDHPTHVVGRDVDPQAQVSDP